MDSRPSGSSVHEILQARILEGVATPSSRGFSQPGDQTQVSLIAGGFLTSWATLVPQVDVSRSQLINSTIAVVQIFNEVCFLEKGGGEELCADNTLNGVI